MTKLRRRYTFPLKINDRFLSEVIIDPHYEAKHSAVINDDLILQLTRFLDGENFEPEDQKGPYTYYTTDPIFLNGANYKLVWVLEDGRSYLGVISAHRR